MNYLWPMSRVMGLDLGKKRTGIAVTDPSRIIVSGLETQPTEYLFDFLKSYFEKENVELVVVGDPFSDDQFESSDWRNWFNDWIEKFKTLFPKIQLDFQDERFSSKDASLLLSQSGKKRKVRHSKEEVDKTSAILILQTYLGHI